MSALLCLLVAAAVFPRLLSAAFFHCKCVCTAVEIKILHYQCHPLGRSYAIRSRIAFSKTHGPELKALAYLEYILPKTNCHDGVR